VPETGVPPSSSIPRRPGFLQGLALLLPISLAVIGVSVFTATVALMREHFKDLPNGDYLVNLLQTMPGFWIVAFSPVAGWLLDRFGRRTILIGAMVVYGVAGTAPFFLENIYVILVTRCFVGMCESIVLISTTTMLCDYFHGATRERWLSGQTAVASLSALLIIWLGGALGARFGWQGPFLVYLYSLLLVVGVIAFTWEPQAEHEQSSVATSSGAQYQTMPWTLMAAIVAITMFGSVCFYSTITQNAIALVGLGVTDTNRIGELSSLASLGVPVGTVLFWRLGRLRIGWLLGVDFLLIGIGFIGMSRASSPLLYTWAADVQQVGCGLVLPTLLVWATRGMAFAIRGRATGIWNGAFGVGLFISGALLTFLGKQSGGLPRAFGMLGNLCLAVAAIAVAVGFTMGKRPVPAVVPTRGASSS
jgi:predicted MFS family arabinose efflux permease